jgi:hypothetical protein
MSDMITRVQKLLAKAQDESIPESEREALMARAAELMHSYNIDAKLLSLKAQVTLAPAMEVFYVTPSFVVQKTSLLNAIAQSFGCRVITPRGKTAAKNGGVAECEVFGFANEIEATQMLYCSAVVVGEMGSATRKREGHTDKSYHTAYWAGFASGIYLQLQEATQKAETEAENKQAGTSLVLASMSDQVDALMKKRYPHIRTVRRKVRSAEGFYAGKSDGQSADLYGRNRVSGNTKSITS